MDGLAIMIGLMILGTYIHSGLTNVARGLKANAVAQNPKLFSDTEIEAMKKDILTKNNNLK